MSIKVVQDVFSPAQKRQLVERVTDAVVSVEGERMHEVTFVVVEQVASGDWAIGGRPMTTEAVRALAAGGPVATPA